MSEKSKVKLPEGNEIKVYEKSIVVGGATLYFNREPTASDIKAVKSIFVAGMRAKQSMISKAYNDFMTQIKMADDIN